MIYHTKYPKTLLSLTLCCIAGLFACSQDPQDPPGDELYISIEDGKSDGFSTSFTLSDDSPFSVLRVRCDQPGGCDGEIRIEILEPGMCEFFASVSVLECGPGMDPATVTAATGTISDRDEDLALEVSTEDGEHFVNSLDIALNVDFEEVTTLVLLHASGMPAMELRADWRVAQPAAPPVFFDDFNYTSPQDPIFRAHGWRARTGGGGPGPEGVQWSADQVEFLEDPTDETNSLMRLIARTNGTLEGTTQAEVYTAQRFFEGTYAARVRFTDSPVQGPDVDGVVQTFFSITPWSMAASLDYSEVDFEYLPNGGWGQEGPTLWQTTWEIAEPAQSVSEKQNFSHEGWNTLVFIVSGGEVHYFVNGSLNSQIGGEVYPESEMGIHFNHWFIANLLSDTAEERIWHQDVDWVLFAPDRTLAPEAVTTEVESFRSSRISRHDSIPQP